MNPEIKQRWAAALLSGKYAQTRYVMYRHWWPASDVKLPNEEFCVIGVLYDLMFQELYGSTLAKEYAKSDTKLWQEYGQAMNKWAGLTDEDWGVGPGLPARAQEKNDSGVDFSALAQFIMEAA